MGNGKFRPSPTESTPLNDHQKIVTCDYVGNPYNCAKFAANPFLGFSGQMDEITQYFYLCLFSGTHPHVRLVDDFSPLMALTTRTLARMFFRGGFVDIAPNFEGEIPQNPNFGAVNRQQCVLLPNYFGHLLLTALARKVINRSSPSVFTLSFKPPDLRP